MSILEIMLKKQHDISILIMLTYIALDGIKVNWETHLMGGENRKGRDGGRLKEIWI